MKIIRVGICILITFAILAFGAVEAWSQSIIQIGAALLFAWWGFLLATGRAEEIRWTPVFWPLLGLELLALLQFVIPLSVYPFLTKLELLRFSSYIILVFLFAQSFRTSKQWRTFVSVSRSTGILSVALFRRSAGPNPQRQTLLGRRNALREGILPGPYVESKSLRGFDGASNSHRARDTRGSRSSLAQQMPLVALLAAIPVGALLMSGSRGGPVAFGSELLLLIVLLWFRGGQRKQLLTFVGALALACGLVAWLGMGDVIFNVSRKMHNPEVSEKRARVDVLQCLSYFP